MASNKHLCAFCGGSAASHEGRLGKLEGPFSVSKNSFETVHVHTQCAVWSPNISQNVDLTLRSVGKEVRRARNLKCSSCGCSGAATGCRVPSCGRCYHLPCAIREDCSFNFELYLMACPEHAALFQKEPAGHTAERAGGPLAHLKLSGRCQQQHRLPAFTAAGRSSKGLKRRNKMTAEQLGEYIDTVKATYISLAEELDVQDGSEPDEAIIAAKDAKRIRKATQHLAPALLRQVERAARPSLSPTPSVLQRLPSHAQQAPAQLVPRRPLSLPQQQQQQQQQAVLAPAPVTAWQPPAGGFANIGGLDHVKQQLREMVLMPLMYPQVFKQLSIQPPRGILLHGPPGTGKTATVRALAAECAAVSAGGKPVALFARKGTDCLGKYAGDAELHLRLLFEMAGAAAPSIIFLDELDGLVPARSVRSSSSDQIFASVVSVMLALMDGLKDRGQVLIIGATNRPDSIDPALRRPGRFDREVYFNLPTQQDRQAILAVQTRSWQQQPPAQLLHELAAATDGWAGADLQSLTAAAVMSAVRRTSPHLGATIELQQQRHAPAPQQQQQEQQQQQGEVRARQQQQALEQQASALQDGCYNGVTRHQDRGSTPAAAPSTTAATQGHTAPASMSVAAGSGVPAAASMSPSSPDPAAAAADIGRGAGGGFLAALSSYMTEQQQQPQQYTWLAPIAVESPGVPASVAAEAEALAAARRSPAVMRESSAATGSPPLAAAAAAMAHLGQALGQQRQLQQPTVQDNTQRPAEANQQKHSPHQEQQLQQQDGLQQNALQQQRPQLQSAEHQSQLPAHRPQPAVLTGHTPSSGPPALPDIQVLPCDWTAALAAAGPPASKREMNSLAALNLAEKLPAVLTPLLLPALAQVVLLLHRWLLLLACGADELAASAATCISSKHREQSCLQFEQLLAQFAAVEQLLSPEHVEGGRPTTRAAEAGDSCTAGQPSAALSTHASSAALQLLPGHDACYRLLVSGHGAAGQSELAAAVLKLLGSAAGAAVHTLSLPGMLLLGDGDAAAGLVAGVREALARTGRGQLLVLFLPRIELWALTPAERRRPCQAPRPAAMASHLPTLPAGGGSTMASAFCSGSGAMHGVISSSSSDEGDSSSDMDDNNAADRERRPHADHEPNNTTLAPVPADSSDTQSRRTQQKQQCQQLRLSTAWSVFEQQLAAVSGAQQSVLVLATCQLPAEVLPHDIQQVFGDSKQTEHQSLLQQEQQGCEVEPAAGLFSTSNSTSATIQTCCCCRDTGCSSSAASALSRALDRAAKAAAVHLGQQLLLSTVAISKEQPACSMNKAPEQHRRELGGVEVSALTEEVAAPAPAVAASDVQQPSVSPPTECQQEPPQHRPRLAESAFEQLNTAQQAQARALFAQVQQQLQMLGSMTLQDPCLRRAVSRQPKRLRKAAKSQQQQLQQVLPLAGVSLKAAAGWYCQLDEFQADFASAVADVRRAHAGGSCYSWAAAAAAYLQDIVAAACREAAQQLSLYDPWNIKLIKAAAEARKAAGQQQQLPTKETPATVQQQTTEQLQADIGSAGADVAVPLHSIPAPNQRIAAASPLSLKQTAAHQALPQGLDQQQQGSHARLQALAADYLQQWKRSQQQRQQSSKHCSTGDSLQRACCWAALHSAVQQYCRDAAHEACVELEQAAAEALQSARPP